VRILITGAGGFAGQHLIAYLLSQNTDDTITGTIYGKDADELITGVKYVSINLMDESDVTALLKGVQPDVIYHLAAQSSPSRSRTNPWATLHNNIRIQFNIMEGCVTLGMSPRILIVASADIYCGVKPNSIPIDETAQLYPSTAYGVSKVTQDMMGMQYFLSHKLEVIRARPFNHIGRGQSLTFVAPDFAMQIAKIENGQQDPVMSVGNLEASRDFTDVRDVVRAYALLAHSGSAGEAYNIASGKAYSIRYMLDTLLSFTDIAIDVRLDEARLRPVDIPIIQGNYQKLHDATGWLPQFTFEEALKTVLEDCRERVQKEKKE